MRDWINRPLARWVAAALLCVAALALGAVLSRHAAAGSGLRISEVLASNSVCPAPDGSYPDFIELHNGGSRDADLSGCGLTDSGRIVKYVFPEGTVLPAGAYLVVWCDAHADAESGFAAFSVSRDGGETISLRNRRGAAIDSAVTVASRKNQSLVRDGEGWTLTDRPTPGFENSEAGYAAYMAGRDDTAVCAVHVSEFMSSNTLYPLPDGETADWIELHNEGETSFDLSGCALTDASDKLKYVFPDGVRIEAGEYLLLRCGEDGLGFSLRADGGETLSFLDAAGRIIDRLTTPTLPRNCSYARAGGEWTLCTEPSPGYENSADGHAAYLTSLGLGECGVRISELMAENRATLTDASGAFSDWIELHNASDRTQDLSGYWLSDDPAQPEKWRIPDGVTLESGAYLLIFCDGRDTNAGGELHAGFSLSRYGETVTLSDPIGTEVDAVTYGALEPDRALSDGAVTDSPSPGFPNTEAGVLAFRTSRAPAGPLVINEVMSVNDTVLRQYNGKCYDWVELKNISDESVRLSDFTLTDDLDEPERFRLPDKELAPGAVWVLLLGGGEDIPTYYDVAPFALNAEEDRLYLLGAGFSPVDYLLVTGVPDGGSIGRMDGETGFFYFAGPTPGRDNASGARTISAAPRSEPAAGVYEGVSGFTVTLSAAPGAEIRYTTDGSVPTAKSKLCEGPIPLEKTAVLRARSFAPGELPSETETFSYFLNEGHELPVVSLVVAPGDLLYFANDFSEQERPANLSFFEPDGSFSIDCGVALFGQTSRKSPKKSYKLQFRPSYDGELAYPLFGDGEPDRFSSLVLRSGQDYPFAIIREELMTSLAAEASDRVPVQAYRYSVLYLNGEYWGIYALKERFSDEYYAAHRQVSPESCTMVRATRVYEEAPDLFALMQYAESHDMKNEEYYRYIEENVDLESLADWLICEIYCGNSDIMNNVRYARTSENGGKWQHCFFDLDWTFLVHGNCLNYAMGRGFQYCKIPVAVFRNPEFRAMFLEHLAAQLKGTFAEEHVLQRIDELCDLIRSEVSRERRRWGGSVQNWEQNVMDIKNYVTKPGRAQELINDACYYLGIGPEERAKYFSEFD